MTLAFDFQSARPEDVQFGVGFKKSAPAVVSTELPVRQALLDMAADTWRAMEGSLEEDSTGPSVYEPADKHSGSEYLVLDIEDDLAANAKLIHTAQHLSTLNNFYDVLPSMAFYFAQFVDSTGNVLTGLKKATEFKGTLNKRAVVYLIGDALRLVDRPTFQLDRDFDMLIDHTQVHVLRPGQFEHMLQLQAAILAAVPKNIALVAEHLPFVACDGLQLYASTRPRAAQYVASIRQNSYGQGVTQELLADACVVWRVEHGCVDGKIVIADTSIMTFLRLLDRRLYETRLVDGKVEQYLAGSRSPFA